MTLVLNCGPHGVRDTLDMQVAFHLIFMMALWGEGYSYDLFMVEATKNGQRTCPGAPGLTVESKLNCLHSPQVQRLAVGFMPAWEGPV